MYFLCVKATVEGWRGGGAWRRPEEQHLNGDVVGRVGERAGEGEVFRRQPSLVMGRERTQATYGVCVMYKNMLRHNRRKL